MSNHNLDKHILGAIARATQAGASIRLGEITTVSPLEIDLLDSPQTLEADRIDLGDWVRLRLDSGGVAAGDVAILAKRPQDHWVLLDVITDTSPSIPASSLSGLPGVGEIIIWSRVALPTGCVLAAGGTFTKAAYPLGYAAAGVEVSAGNAMWTRNIGAETFTVPNLTDRFVLQKGAKTFGSTGGAENVTLTAAQSGMPAHNHPWNDSGFGVGVNNENNPAGAVGHYQRAGSGNPIGNVSAQDAAQSHTNMPPWIALAYLVRLA